MIDLPDVDTLWAGGLGAWLESQQADRAATRRKIWNIGAAALVIGAVLALAGYAMGGLGVAYFLGALVAMGGLGWAALLRQKMVDRLKQEMNGRLAQAIGVEYRLVPQTGAEFDRAGEYGLLPDHDDAVLQDGWSGSVHGTDFFLYEAKLTETRGSGKNRRTVTVFRGILLQMRFARGFAGTTLVRRDGFKFTLFGDSKNYAGERLDRIAMVDPRFEEAFDVYGTDQVEGRYLVHPAYCERLLELERDFFGDKLCALFYGGDLLVTIHSQDLFESATLDPAHDRQRLAQTIDQFAAVSRLIATLNERPRR